MKKTIKAGMQFRINYANGQVGPTKTYQDARNELVSLRHVDHAHLFRIERFDGAEWSTIGKAGRLQTATEEGL